MSETDTYYESRFVFDPTRAVVWKEIVRYLSAYIPKSGTVIDLGAGYCDFINNVSAKERIAIDTSPELSRFAAPGVRAVRGTTAELSKVADSSVDVILASNLVEHVNDSDLAQMMKDARRILKKDGSLILMQPNFRLSYKTYFDDFTHVRAWTDAGLEAYLVSEGFTVVKKHARFLPFSLRSRPSIIPVHPWIVRAYIHSPIKPFAGQMLLIAKPKK